MQNLKILKGLLVLTVVLGVIGILQIGTALYTLQEPGQRKEKTVEFYCDRVGNAQVKSITKKATGQIIISNNGNIIRYKYAGINYILTNASCQFGSATKNVTIRY